jgi:hypothetical protein
MAASLTSTIAQAYISELFGRHGIACDVRDEWILPRSGLPALRAAWYPGSTSGRLDVEVLVREGVLIQESFAGIGEGNTGLMDGLGNFTLNSFHVMLAALWGQNDPEQVTTEAWSIAGRKFLAYIGNVGTRSSSAVTPHIPTELMSELEKAIRAESLQCGTHWFRVYAGHLNANSTLEALMDNAEWPAGLSALKGLPWEKIEGFYSVRLFVILNTVVDSPGANPTKRWWRFW